MKKVLYSAALLLLATLTSCEKEDIENTATVNMAGQWYVQVDAVDDAGKPIKNGEDYFGFGRVVIVTCNTAANSTSEMLIDDLGGFDVAAGYGNGNYPSYSLKSKINVDLGALTFSSNNATNLSDKNKFDSDLYPITIEGGKILPGAGRQNNGSVADSIVFYVKYAGDPWFPDDGYAKYKVSGIRYSGLVEND